MTDENLKPCQFDYELSFDETECGGTGAWSYYGLVTDIQTPSDILVRVKHRGDMDENHKTAVELAKEIVRRWNKETRAQEPTGDAVEAFKRVKEYCNVSTRNIEPFLFDAKRELDNDLRAVEKYLQTPAAGNASESVDVEALKMHPDTIELPKESIGGRYTYSLGWNDCLEYLAAQGLLSGKIPDGDLQKEWEGERKLRQDAEAKIDALYKMVSDARGAWLCKDDQEQAVWQAIQDIKFGNKWDDKMIVRNLHTNGFYIAAAPSTNKEETK